MQDVQKEFCFMVVATGQNFHDVLKTKDSIKETSKKRWISFFSEMRSVIASMNRTLYMNIHL